jgi:hypothetical protein
MMFVQLIAKHKELYPQTIPPVTPTVVSRLASHYVEGQFDAPSAAVTEGHGHRKAGHQGKDDGAEVVRVGTMIRTMTTMVRVVVLRFDDRLRAMMMLSLYCRVETMN